MNIHEYQAKIILSKNGIKIPKGKVAYTANEAKKVAKELSNKGPWMLKAQIQSGSRQHGRFIEARGGNKGGIRLVKKIDDLVFETDSMLGSTLVTNQTGPKGKFVSRVYVEPYLRVGHTFYVGMAIDRVAAKVVLLVANTKDDDIGTLVASNPDKIFRLPLNLKNGPTRAELEKVAEFLKLALKSRASFHQFVRSMYKSFMENDALMIEINPAAIMKNNDDVVALDAKMVLDDNALYRHPEHKNLKDDYEADARELRASRYGFAYQEFDGNIGCIVNGDGLALALMDLLEDKNNKVACTLNVKGGVDRDQIANGIKTIVTSPKVEGIIINIVGGFVRCDLIADGIIDAAAEVGMNLPVVVRLEGTNRLEAENILGRAKLPVVIAEDMEDAVNRIIKAVESNECRF